MLLRFAIPSIAIAAMLTACGGTNVSNIDADPNNIDADLTLPDGATDAATECVDPPPLVCDFFLSCGCDVPGGEKCSLVNDVPACTAAGSGLAGDTCGIDGDCEPGTLCASDSGELHCMTYCDSIHPCPSGGACFIRVVDSTQNQLAEVCGQTCSLLGQDCAIGTQGCYPASVAEPTMERGICITAGTGVQDEPCTFGDDCAAGFSCVMSGNETICAEICDRDAPNCATGTCVELIGHTRTGVCL